MPNKKARWAGRFKFINLRDETAAYLRTTEWLNLDPIKLRPTIRSGAELAKWQTAKGELLTAIKQTPESSEVYKYMGVLFLEQGEFEKAEYQFNESLKRLVTADVLTLSGVTKSRLDKLRPARRMFQQAINVDRDYKGAYYNLAITLSYTKHDKAVRLFRTALDLDPDYAAALRELGWALKLRGQHSDAERYLRRSIKLDELDGWAYIYFGNLMWDQAEPAEAEQAYKSAIKVCPKEGTPYWCLADFYNNAGRLRQAKGLYLKAVRLDPDSAVANSRFGLFLMQLGDNTRAKVYLERALELDPGFERVTVALGELNR